MEKRKVNILPKNKVQLTLDIIVIADIIITAGLFIAYKNVSGLARSILLILTVVFATLLYHFGMRLIAGGLVKGLSGTFNYDNAFFREKKFEQGFYKFIKVKVWKDKVPTYSEEDYDLTNLTYDQVIQNTCMAETTHWTMAFASFLPIVVPIITKQLAHAIIFPVAAVIGFFVDIIFVIVQRYNRPRLAVLKKFAERKKQDKKNKESEKETVSA